MRDKLKRRVQDGNSTRSVPDDAPRFSFKSEFRFREVETEQDQEIDHNNSSLSESSPVDIDNSYQGHELQCNMIPGKLSTCVILYISCDFLIT